MNKIDALLDVLYKIYAILKFLQIQLSQTQSPLDVEEMTRQDVKNYLGISESTYKRKVKEGILKPLKLPGGDRFYKYQLEDQYRESIRRGRI